MKLFHKHIYYDPLHSDFIFGDPGQGLAAQIVAEVTFGGDVGIIEFCDIQTCKWHLVGPGFQQPITNQFESLIEFVGEASSNQVLKFIGWEELLFQSLRELHCPKAAAELETTKSARRLESQNK